MDRNDTGEVRYAHPNPMVVHAPPDKVQTNAQSEASAAKARLWVFGAIVAGIVIVVLVGGMQRRPLGHFAPAIDTSFSFMQLASESAWD